MAYNQNQNRYGRWQALYNLNSGAAKEERDRNISQAQQAGQNVAQQTVNAVKTQKANIGDISDYSAKDDFATDSIDKNKMASELNKYKEQMQQNVQQGAQQIGQQKNEVQAYGDMSKFGNKMQQQNSQITDQQKAMAAWYTGVNGKNPIVAAAEKRFGDIEKTFGEQTGQAIEANAKNAESQAATQYAQAQDAKFWENAKNKGFGGSQQEVTDKLFNGDSILPLLDAVNVFNGLAKSGLQVSGLPGNMGAQKWSQLSRDIVGRIEHLKQNGAGLTPTQYRRQLSDINNGLRALRKTTIDIAMNAPKDNPAAMQLNKLAGKLMGMESSMRIGDLFTSGVWDGDSELAGQQAYYNQRGGDSLGFTSGQSQFEYDMGKIFGSMGGNAESGATFTSAHGNAALAAQEAEKKKRQQRAGAGRFNFDDTFGGQ